jgi:NAD(P)-dependent dehydrogenase (short-subunit alcohol dehydrogenase family)
LNPAGAVVLITGASSGIGRAAALAFDRAGSRVALAARRRGRLEELAASMRDALVVETDLGDEAQAAAMVNRTVAYFGRLDVLINVAGIAFLRQSDALDPAEVRRVLEVNFIGAMVATNSAVGQMLVQPEGGQIINVGSPSGYLGTPLLAGYSAAKGAMHGWTRAVQAEWAGSRIRVTEYNPGLIDTEMGAATVAASDLGKGTVGIDIFQDPEQSWLTRRLNAPLAPERVAEHLVSCVRRPRLAMYSGLSLRVVMALANVAAVRFAMSAGIGRAFRARLGWSTFSQRQADRSRQGGRTAPNAPGSPRRTLQG